MIEPLVVVPTQREAAAIDTARVRPVIGGVGMAAISATLSRALRETTPSLVILAGIAGSYGDALPPGEAVLVASERVADLGAMREGRFEALYPVDYRCPCATLFPEFKSVAANTVSVAGAPWVAPADVENMEGAAFFALCLAHGVPFVELRTISNRVGDPREKWNIPLAAEQLAAALHSLLEMAKYRL
ncbi:Futalosine hydrolase [Bacteroidia bacterium]|nr:Futalosine hydrolase [Bacteroidia bacterium]